MKQTIKIRCKNNKKTGNFPIGSTLSEIFSDFGLQMNHGPISARVNNKVEGMHYRVYHNKDVEFLDMTASSASRAYTRSLFLVLCKAVKDLFGLALVVIDIPVSNGFYCDLKLGRPITEEDVNRLRTRMQEIIDAEMPITRHECPTEEAIQMFDRLGDIQKAKILRSSGQLYCCYYDLDGYVDYFYGTLVTNTRELYLFGLEKYYDGLLLRMTEESFDKIIANNLKSAFNYSHAVTPGMMRQRSGSMIFMSSCAGVHGNAGQVNYGASKAGLLGLAKSICKELGPRGVRANCISPGMIDSEMVDRLSDKVKEFWLANIPMHRWGTKEEVAGVALFLASDLSTYVNGEVISCCGGVSS